MVDDSRLARWLLLSLLLHALLVPLLAVLRKTQIDIAAPKFVDIDLTAPLPKPRPAAPPVAPQAPAPAAQAAIPLPKSQIVTPPDAGEEKAPANTRLLSDRDNLVPEEKVKRAPVPSVEDVPKREDASPEARPQAAPEAKKPAREEARKEAKRVVEARPAARPEPRPADNQVAALPRLEQLLPSGGDFAAIAKQAAQESEAPQPSQRESEKRRLMIGDNPAFAMRPGISDFLPGIKEGSITLLNTKAERFAPFVRRVAGRVFQHLDIRLRQTARSGSGATGGHEYAVVEAIMSKGGRLISAKVVERQSNSSLAADRILLSVTEPDTFFDANPPPGAEGNDGNIHFLLMIDLQVQAVQDPRSGRTAIGYYGMAGVGLDAVPGRRGSDG